MVRLWHLRHSHTFTLHLSHYIYPLSLYNIQTIFRSLQFNRSHATTFSTDTTSSHHKMSQWHVAGTAINVDNFNHNKDNEWACKSRVLHPAWHITKHFSDESFQVITWTGTTENRNQQQKPQELTTKVNKIIQLPIHTQT